MVMLSNGNTNAVLHKNRAATISCMLAVYKYTVHVLTSLVCVVCSALVHKSMAVKGA